MANVPIQDSEDGGTPTFQAADPAGDSCENDGQTFLRFIVPSMAEYTISVQNGRQCQFGDHPAYDMVSPVGQTQLESPRFSTFRFNASGRMSWTYAPDVVGVQVAAMRHHLQVKDVIS